MNDSVRPRTLRRRRRIALLVAGVLAVAGLPAAIGAVPVPGVSTAPAAEAATTGKEVIANLFEWNWKSVARECTDVLGPAGYGAVQVSPPQDSLTRAGHPWWEVYQPANYNLTSRMGDRAAFAAMVRACHGAGVKVYVDAVINHMTGQGSASYGGTSFGKYNYPGVYSAADFHYYPNGCGNSDNLIKDADYTGSAGNVQNCELVGLSDLNTGSDYVRGKIAAYLNDLIGIGVDGFRVDAAKHMSPGDLSAIYSRLNGSPYIYQEVIYGRGEAVQPSSYTGLADVLEFQYGRELKTQFTGSTIKYLSTFGPSWGLSASSDQSVVFVDNHDTERNGSTLSYKNGATYTLANVFMLGWNFGTPNVYSAFSWSNGEAGPPSDGNGYVTDAACGSGWECQHRQKAITGMVGFRNAVGTAAVRDFQTANDNFIGFGRGDAGFVAINNNGGATTHTFRTGLAPGAYCDVIGGWSGGVCSGNRITVAADGTASLTVPGKGAVAIHVGARLGASPSPTGGNVATTFNVNATTAWGTNVFVVGSIPALGGWDPAKAVALSSARYPIWSATVSLPAGTAFEYKYVKKDGAGNVTWESGANRAGAPGTVNDTWK